MLAVVLFVLVLHVGAQASDVSCLNLTKAFSYNSPDASVQYRTIRVEASRFGAINVHQGTHSNGQVDVHANLFHTNQQIHSQVKEILSETVDGPVLTIVAVAGGESLPHPLPLHPPQASSVGEGVAVLRAGMDLRVIAFFLLVLVASSGSKRELLPSRVHPLLVLLTICLLTHAVYSECPQVEVNVTLPANVNSAGELCVSTVLAVEGDVQVLTITDTCVDEEEDIVLGDCQLRGFSLPACDVPLDFQFAAAPALKYLGNDGCVASNYRLREAEITLKNEVSSKKFVLPDFSPKHCRKAEVDVIGSVSTDDYLAHLKVALESGDFEVALTVRNARGATKTVTCNQDQLAASQQVSLFQHVMPDHVRPSADLGLCWGADCKDFSSKGDFVSEPSELDAPVGLQGALRLSASACRQSVQIGISTNPFCQNVDILPMTNIESFLEVSSAEADEASEEGELLYRFSATPPASKQRKGGKSSDGLKSGSGYYLQVTATNSQGSVTKCFSKAFIVA